MSGITWVLLCFCVSLSLGATPSILTFDVMICRNNAECDLGMAMTIVLSPSDPLFSHTFTAAPTHPLSKPLSVHIEYLNSTFSYAFRSIGTRRNPHELVYYDEACTWAANMGPCYDPATTAATTGSPTSVLCCLDGALPLARCLVYAADETYTRYRLSSANIVLNASITISNGNLTKNVQLTGLASGAQVSTANFSTVLAYTHDGVTLPNTDTDILIRHGENPHDASKYLFVPDSRDARQVDYRSLATCGAPPNYALLSLSDDYFSTSRNTTIGDVLVTTSRYSASVSSDGEWLTIRGMMPDMPIELSMVVEHVS